jgi:glutathione S-transferase
LLVFHSDFSTMLPTEPPRNGAWPALLHTQRNDVGGCVPAKEYLRGRRRIPQPQRLDALAWPLPEWNSPRGPGDVSPLLFPKPLKQATPAAASDAKELEFLLSRATELLQRTSDHAALPAAALQKLEQIAAFHAAITPEAIDETAQQDLTPGRPAEMAKLPVTLTYWDLHGLGDAPRMALHFAGVAFNDEILSDRPNWRNERYPELEKAAPFANLPYLTTGEGERIVQSAAVMRYIGRRHGLYGATERDVQRVDLVMDVVVEFKAEFYPKIVYGGYPYPRDEFEKIKQSFVDNSVPYYVGGWERMLKENGTALIAADVVTIADFMVVSFLQQIVDCFDGDDVLQPFPAVLAYLRAFQAQSAMASYYASPGSNVTVFGPVSNIMLIRNAAK